MNINYTRDRPDVNTEANHSKRLETEGLRWGATLVCKDRSGRFWAVIPREFSDGWGYTPKDVDANVARMVEVMKAEGLTLMGKAYDSDIYKSKQTVTNRIIQQQVESEPYNVVVEVNPQLPISTEAPREYQCAMAGC